MNKSLENFFDQYQNIIETGIENAWSSRQITDTIYKNEFKNYIKKGLQPRLDEIRKVKGFVEFLRKSAEDTGSSGQTYIWRTENDGKTRPEHAAKEGQTFIWDEDENPGEDYGCRCRAEFLDGTLGRTKYDEDGNKTLNELKDKDGGVDLMAENTSKILNGRGIETGIKNPNTPGGLCGRYTGLALEAAGFEEFKNRPALAKNYGDPLEKAGFEEINSGNASTLPDKYSPRKGDVVVFQDYPGQKDAAGHVQMFDGERWISDFVQGNAKDSDKLGTGFYPGAPYVKNNTPYKIYRSNDW